jgi:hypothetical protein
MGSLAEKFTKVPTEIVRDPILPDAAKVLYAEIGTYAWESLDSWCTASQATLAADLGWGVTKLKRWTQALVDRGLIEVESHGRTLWIRPLGNKADSPPATDRNGRDSPPATDQIARRQTTNKTKRTRALEDNCSRIENGRSSRNGGGDTTTTTDGSLIVEAKALLAEYEATLNDHGLDVPQRRPKDLQAALEAGAEGWDLVNFGEVYSQALEDEDGYTLQRNWGFASAASAYRALRAQGDSRRRVACTSCNKLRPRSDFRGSSECVWCEESREQRNARELAENQ